MNPNDPALQQQHQQMEQQEEQIIQQLAQALMQSGQVQNEQEAMQMALQIVEQQGAEGAMAMLQQLQGGQPQGGQPQGGQQPQMMRYGGKVSPLRAMSKSNKPSFYKK